MTSQTPSARPGMIDWDLAVRVGSRLVGEGPQVTRSEAVEAVEELRAGHARADGGDGRGLALARVAGDQLVDEGFEHCPEAGGVGLDPSRPVDDGDRRAVGVGDQTGVVADVDLGLLGIAP